MAVRVTTLGAFRVERGGRSLDRLPAARNRSALLLHIAVEREVTRDSAMALLWPERPPARARHLLSQTLYELRQELGEAWVEASGERLCATAELGADVVDFAAAVEGEEYESALELYGGPFLPGSALAVSRPMEGWIDSHQARVARLHRRARRGAIDGCVDAGRLRDALALARSWVEMDPLDDEAQHRLIELMAATGDRSGALRQYDRYERLVEEELELEPLDETRELVQRIRAGEVGERKASHPAGREVSADRVEPAGPARGDGEADGGDEPAPRQDVASLRHVRRRKVVEWTLAYFAGALVVMEGTKYLGEELGWPAAVLRGLTLLLGLGALGVLGYSWLSTEGRRERVGPVDALLIAAVVLFSGVAISVASQPNSVIASNEERAFDHRRIAVLFFHDYSPAQNMDPLAAGFTHALINELSRVDGLTVLSRAAVAPYRGKNAPLDSIVSDLGAGTIVAGSITNAGDRLHVTYELIDGETRNTLYSDTLQRSMDQVASLQADLPREVAISLRTQLGVEIELRETRQATDDSEAWTLVQRAEAQREFERDLWEDDLGAALQRLERADSMLARAERLDPEWASPTVRRAEIAATRARRTGHPAGSFEPEATRQALRHLERALRRDPDNPEALQARGLLRFELAEQADAERAPGLYGMAEADLLRAVDLDPSQAEAWWALSKLHRRQASFAEAKADARRAMDADAFLESTLANMFQMAHTALELEEHGEAAYWCERLDRRFPQEPTGAYCTLWLMGSAPVLEPDPDSAWALARRLERETAENQRQYYVDWGRIMVAKTLARAGAADSARSLLENHFADGVPDYGTYDAAHARLMIGDEERALELLEEYVEFRPARRSSLPDDWFFEPLHGDPRFSALVGAPGPD